MRLNFTTAIGWLLTVAVAATPLFSVGEVLALLQGTELSQVVPYSPVYVKGAKDVFLALVAILAVAAMLATGRTSRLVLPVAAFLLYTGAAALESVSAEPRLALAGLRWTLPMVLAVLLVRHVDVHLLQRIARVLARLLLLHVALQLFQLVFMPPFYGVTAFGLASRVPGMFLLPNTAGFFSVTALYFAVFHLHGSRLRRVVFVLAPLSVVLTQSGTGLVTLVAFVALMSLGPRRAVVLAPAAPVLAMLLLVALPVLTGRGEQYVAISGGTRVQILRDMFAEATWFPRLFGFATNTAVSFAASLDTGDGSPFKAVIVDSTYASVLGNLGLVGFLALALCFAAWVLLLLHTTRRDLYAFTLIFTLYGATTILSEAFPMSALAAILVAHFLRTVYLPALDPLVRSRSAPHGRPTTPAASASAVRA